MMAEPLTAAESAARGYVSGADIAAAAVFAAMVLLWFFVIVPGSVR